MPNIHVPPGWLGREMDALSWEDYLSRRRFLKSLGFAGLGVLLAGCGHSETFFPLDGPPCDPEHDLPPTDQFMLDGVTANSGYLVQPERAVTSNATAISFNNFYEFTEYRQGVWCLAQSFTTDPWSVAVSGLAMRTGTFALEDIIAIAGLEERVYRFRCVEAWAMTVPWVGIPLATFIQWCQPLNDATHVRFISAFHPDEMPNRSWVWPYYEGLRLDEALNPVAFLAVGLYGKVLPGQNGAPVRVIVPWKYGYKSVKSIVGVEFTSEQPPTFWNDVDPEAYGFLSNVDPNVPHPLWSQESETLLGSGDRVPTLKYNGYGEWVASLYE